VHATQFSFNRISNFRLIAGATWSRSLRGETGTVLGLRAVGQKLANFLEMSGNKKAMKSFSSS